MSSGGTISKPSGDADQTKPGNYFVSNYPPFAFWNADSVPAVVDVLNRAGGTEVPLGLYVHLPFCRKRCHFCYFKVYTDRNAAAIQEYIAAVLREARLYADKPLLAGRALKFIYFGGGTPSYLSARQLTELTTGLRAVLPWDGLHEFTFECEPGTLTETKLKTLRELGVTRLSLGIENFSDRVLQANGRAHLSREISTAYELARKIGFTQINIDLIAGMLEETEQNWIENVRKAIGLEPDCVTIYQMEIPFNTTIYREMTAQGRLDAPVADWETKRRWVGYAFDRLEQAGYVVTSAYTAVRDPSRTQFVYRDTLWRGADMLALGVSSFGHLSQVHYQNEKNIDVYMQRLQSDELPIFRALPISPEEASIREMVLQLKTGALDRDYFRRKFGWDVVERHQSVFDRLQADRLLGLEPNSVTLEREGLLRVDAILHQFFLPQHRAAGRS